MSDVKVILFDIGNVFVKWDPRYLYETLIPDSEELAYFLENVVTLAWHTHHDKGLPFAEGVKNLSAEFPQYAELIAAFDARWCDTIGPVFEGTLDILNTLSEKGMPLYALTNFSAEKWPEFVECYEFPKKFDGVVVSGEVGLVKPDPAIYALTAERFGLVPAETLFIDDRPDNIKAAEAMGFQGHLFTSPEALKADLKDRGVL